MARRNLCDRCARQKEVRALYPPLKQKKMDRSAPCSAGCGKPIGPNGWKGMCGLCYYHHRHRERKLKLKQSGKDWSVLPEGYVLPELDEWEKYHFPDAPEPTQAPPGSWDKVEVMVARRSAGFGIFHPNDLVLEVSSASAERPEFYRSHAS